MATVCSVCQAVNRDSAKFCKGCAGRLPAFYGAGVPVDTGFGVTGPGVLSGAGGGSGATVVDAPDFRASARAMLEPASRAFGASAMWVAVALVLLFAVFVIWYVAYVPGRPSAAAALQPPAPSVVAPAVLAAPAPVADTRAEPIEREPLTSAEAAILAEPPAKAAPVLRPYVPEYQPAAPREVQLPAPPPRVAAEAPQHSANGPLAACMGMNFFAKAICMNNRCAQPANAGHPQCAEVLRQRRIDEARRNPTMIN